MKSATLFVRFSASNRSLQRTRLNFHSQWKSIYHGFQLSGVRRLASGLTLLAAYTFGQTIDQGSFPTARLGLVNGTVPQNANDFRSERGLANFDQRNRFTLSGVWELPWASKSRGWRRAALAGWQFAPLLTLAGGQPFLVVDGTDPNADGVIDRPDVIRNPNLPKGERTLNRFWDTGAFVRLPPGTNRFGNSGRNIVIGPGLANLDAALSKRFPLTETLQLLFRTEAFNVTNHPNFVGVGGGSPINNITSPLFGQILATVPNNERILQFSLRLTF